jgi:hypothetical protein
MRYLRDGTFIHSTAHGVVTDAELRDHVQEMYESDARTRRYRCALQDFSRVEEIKISSDAIREVAAMNLEAAKLVPPGAAVAIVASNPLMYGLGRMWEAWVAESGWRTRVFEDCGEAERWLEEQLEAQGPTEVPAEK